MSTWTCKVRRRLRQGGLAVTLALSLSGCWSIPMTPLSPADFAAKQVLSGASLFDGAVIIRTPPGYCVDGDSLLTKGTSFALIAACPLLQGRADADVDPVLITVTGQAHDGPLPDIAAMAATMQPARAIEAIEGDGLTVLHLFSGAPGPLAGGDPRHWRGVMLVNGHMISLALFAPDGSPMADRAGLGLIGALSEAIRKASPTGAPAPSGAAPSALQKNPATDDRNPRPGLLGRLSLALKTG